jgi:hypothetical protein
MPQFFQILETPAARVFAADDAVVHEVLGQVEDLHRDGGVRLGGEENDSEASQASL